MLNTSIIEINKIKSPPSSSTPGDDIEGDHYTLRVISALVRGSLWWGGRGTGSAEPWGIEDKVWFIDTVWSLHKEPGKRWGWDPTCHIKRLVFYSETNVHALKHMFKEGKGHGDILFLEKDFWYNMEDQFPIILLAPSNFILC